MYFSDSLIFCLQSQRITNQKSPQIVRFTGFKFHLMKTLWSRGESNSRPDKQLKGFLHVYFPIGFSSLRKARNSHTMLIF